MASSIRLRTLLLLSVLSLAALVAAPAAFASTPGNYTFTTQHGKAFPLLSNRNIVPAVGTTDDALFTLSTSASGASRLPFKLRVYGVRYRLVRVSSNGNLQFGVGPNGGSAAFANDPLPSADFTGPTLAVFWDDLFFTPSDTSHFFQEGIFTKVRGHKPHRTYVISWQGNAFNNSNYAVLAQAVFKEGSQTIRFRYGAPDNQPPMAPSETIGTQGPGGTTAHFTQIAFDPPPPGAVAAGTQFTLRHH